MVLKDADAIELLGAAYGRLIPVIRPRKLGPEI